MAARRNRVKKLLPCVCFPALRLSLVIALRTRAAGEEGREARALRFREVKDAFEVLIGRKPDAEPAARGAGAVPHAPRQSVHEQLQGLKARAAARARRRREQQRERDCAREPPCAGPPPSGTAAHDGAFRADRRRIDFQLRGLRQRRRSAA